jgi:hypothetical protein
VVNSYRNVCKHHFPRFFAECRRKSLTSKYPTGMPKQFYFSVMHFIQKTIDSMSAIREGPQQHLQKSPLKCISELTSMDACFKKAFKD